MFEGKVKIKCLGKFLWSQKTISKYRETLATQIKGLISIKSSYKSIKKRADLSIEKWTKDIQMTRGSI